MSIPNYLKNLKSAGIYRFVFDKSQISNEEATTLRLVVGYSEKGPFNTPVYINNIDDFKNIFGGINKKLERYGVYFHRMAIQALSAGPILALNLKKFDDEKVKGVSFDAADKIGEAIETEINNLYNTTRFWKLEPEHLEELSFGKYIDITATDTKETSCSIFMRSAHPSGYDVTLKDWYASVLNGQELPEYMEAYADTLVSQYFASIYVFRGEFTPQVATSENLAKYFDVNGTNVKLKPYIEDAFGNKIDTLEALAANSASNVVGIYSGVLLPDFQSAQGGVISLDTVFNADYDNHKMMMRLNQEMLYAGDINLESCDTTGWQKGINGQTSVGNMMSALNIVPTTLDFEYDDTTDPSNPVWKATANGNADANYYAYPFDNLTINNTDSTATTTQSLNGANINVGDKFLGANSDVVVVTDIASEVEEYFKNHSGGSEEYQVDAQGNPEGLTEYSANFVIPYVDDASNPTEEGTITAYETIAGDPSSYTVISATSTIGSITFTAGNVITFGASDEILVGGQSLSPSVSVNGTITRVADFVEDTLWSDASFDHTHNYNIVVYKEADLVSETNTTITFDKDVLDNGDKTLYKCNTSICGTCENCDMTPTYIEGYERNASLAKPQGKTDYDKLVWIKTASLSALKDYEGLSIALTSNIDVEYRYMVDTYDSFVENECKGILTTVIRNKDNSILLANFPKMKTFANCKYTSFTDSNNQFNTKYIPMGGNPSKLMGMKFSLPSEESGASWVGFFTQVILREPNTNIKVVCPSAALVSNRFVEKMNSRQPYNVVAGPDFSRFTETGLIGPDFNFTRQDLDNLEPFGVNCIVYAPHKGIFINANQTAKQNPVTSLSALNVRELVIYIQDEVESILQDYQWWTNDADLRAKIKQRVDYLLENIQSNKGIYDYNTVCDESNNTSEIIDKGMFIIDVAIEAAKGAGLLIQQLTLYRKGGISSMTIQ